MIYPDDEEVIGDICLTESSEIITKEIQCYLATKTKVKDDSCPLNFYKSNELLLSNLTNIAKMLFSTTASSVPSECLFSSGGELVTKKRTRIQPECAEDLLFLKTNKDLSISIISNN